MNFGGFGGGRTYSTLHFLFIIHQQRVHNNGMMPDLKKKKKIIIYIVHNFDRFFDYILKYFFKNKWKSLKIGHHTIVVHTILSRMVYIFPSEIKIERLKQFWVRPV